MRSQSPSARRKLLRSLREGSRCGSTKSDQRERCVDSCSILERPTTTGNSTPATNSADQVTVVAVDADSITSMAAPLYSSGCRRVLYDLPNWTVIEDGSVDPPVSSGERSIEFIAAEDDLERASRSHQTRQLMAESIFYGSRDSGEVLDVSSQGIRGRPCRPRNGQEAWNAPPGCIPESCGRGDVYRQDIDVKPLFRWRRSSSVAALRAVRPFRRRTSGAPDRNRFSWAL